MNTNAGQGNLVRAWRDARSQNRRPDPRFLSTPTGESTERGDQQQFKFCVRSLPQGFVEELDHGTVVGFFLLSRGRGKRDAGYGQVFLDLDRAVEALTQFQR